ncbi:MarR family transcriptional regulator [Paenibacillus sp.]|uniref:MarR family winged helix-turn-helix transcriptional regulator n=1 Tax=Paenibacillus sp. TaxID=58172 RepID=UPI002D4EB9AE|nr:MarR family transcriptional regulator [Paenibacillus sp.]HZG57615.1 MarR family transcriptional regulator [Paenibacillus sp.]
MDMDQQQLSMIIERYEEASFVVTRRINAAIRERMSEDLTLEQYAVIRYMRKRDRCTSSELADTFCVGKSSVTAIINRLFDKRLIERLPDEKDRRVTYLRLTAEGERLSEEMEERIRELLSRYLQHFEKDEALRFIATYEKLAQVLLEP